MDRMQINSLDYEELVKFFISLYVKEFGERKFNTIYQKVMTSDKISGLISTSRFKSMPPGSNNFLYCLNEIPYFIFSRGQTQAVAGLIALERWNIEVNSDLFLVSDEGLRVRALGILEESKVTFF